MISCVPPLRKIASNLLWTGHGLLRNPLLTLDAQGRVVRCETCAQPDRSPFTEFCAGVLVPRFPDDYRAVFARMAAAGAPLDEQLAAMEPVCGDGVPVVISGLDYATLRPGPLARIRRL